MAAFNTLISGGNKLEKYRTGFQLIFAILLSFFFIPSALYAIFRKRVYDMKTVGKILDVSDGRCETDCRAHYEYTVGDQTYSGSSGVSDSQDSTKTISLFYNPENPSEAGPASTDTLTQPATGRVTYVVSREPKACERYAVNRKTTTKTPVGSRTATKEIPMYKCFLTYEYTVKGKRYVQQAMRDSSIEYKPGQTIDVFYESTNPANSRFASDDYRLVGGIASSIIVTSVIGLLVHYYLVSNVQGYGSLVLASRMMRS